MNRYYLVLTLMVAMDVSASDKKEQQRKLRERPLQGVSQDDSMVRTRSFMVDPSAKQRQQVKKVSVTPNQKTRSLGKGGQPEKKVSFDPSVEPTSPANQATPLLRKAQQSSAQEPNSRLSGGLPSPLSGSPVHLSRKLNVTLPDSDSAEEEKRQYPQTPGHSEVGNNPSPKTPGQTPHARGIMQRTAEETVVPNDQLVVAEVFAMPGKCRLIAGGCCVVLALTALGLIGTKLAGGFN